MLFSSITFLYYFLPCTILLYFIMPKKGKNLILLLASLFFYGWGEPKNIGIILISILLGYLFGILMDYFKERPVKKVFLVFSICSSLGVLAYFKYTNFILTNLNSLFHSSISWKKIALPIGISFYTFQILSYTIDVYRQKVNAQKNPILLATYVALFPQLIAGPIVRYIDIEKSLTKRTASFDQIAAGIRRFLIGLSKKTLIANPLGELSTLALSANQPSVLFYWTYAIAFTLQIYYDFSGYSDMAIGLGKLFGFDFMENFNYPYISKSITEFWRRWHISLGNWFRDYVYIPLGGNRVSKLKWYRNLLIVWFFTGFWHGANWNFIAWGLFYGILLLIEKAGFLQLLNRCKVFNHLYVMFMVILGFVLFNGNSLTEICFVLRGMFSMTTAPFKSPECLYALRNYGFLLLLSILGATPFFVQCKNRLQKKKEAKLFLDVVELLFYPVLFLLITAYLIDASFNPFLYFRF